MIKLSIIKKLKTYKNSSYQILSVFLGADSAQSPTGVLLTKQFHSLLHKHLNKDLREAFKSDIVRIEEYLSKYKPLARSLIFFSAGEHLWEVVELEFSVQTNMSVSQSPNIDPILQSLQEYTKYLVVLVDREKARMFTVEQGEISDHSEFIGGYVPQKIKSTGRESSGGDGDIISRHNKVLLQRHIDLSVQAVTEFTKNNDIHFVIIGGHTEMFKKVAKSLPSSLQTKIAGNFVTEINIPLNEILLKSKKIASMVM